MDAASIGKVEGKEWRSIATATASALAALPYLVLLLSRYASCRDDIPLFLLGVLDLTWAAYPVFMVCALVAAIPKARGFLLCLLLLAVPYVYDWCRPSRTIISTDAAWYSTRN